MVKIRLLVLLLIAAFLGTLIPALRARHVLTVQAAAPAVMAEGDREVAFFHTSTSTSNWERLIAGLHHSARDLPGLKIDDLRAFLDQTTAIPEVAIHREGCPGRLVVRWYKLGGGLGHREWIQALAKRDIPPIAVLGGGSSDRAVDLAKVLQAQETWNGPRPLFLISTATVNQLDPLAYPDTAEQLMQIYPGRSFRFCYHNQQMAHAVLDFLFRAPATQDLRPAGHPRPEAVAALIGVAPNWPTLLPFAQRALKPTRVQVFSLAWRDDPYSLDLADQFENELKKPRREQRLPRNPAFSFKCPVFSRSISSGQSSGIGIDRRNFACLPETGSRTWDFAATNRRSPRAAYFAGPDCRGSVYWPTPDHAQWRWYIDEQCLPRLGNRLEFPRVAGADDLFLPSKPNRLGWSRSRYPTRQPSNFTATDQYGRCLVDGRIIDNCCRRLSASGYSSGGCGGVASSVDQSTAANL